jgi:hypothetical protein
MPRALVVIASAAALLACTGVTDTDTDSDTDTDVAVDTAGVGGCPASMAPATSASIEFTRFTRDSADLGVSFNPDGIYSGQPAACVDDVGRTAVLTFVVGETAYGSVTLTLDEVGTYELTENTGVLAVDLYGATVPAVYEGDEWRNGTVRVTTIDPTHARVETYGVDGSHTLNIDMTIDITP